MSAAGGANLVRRLNTFDIFVGNLPADADQKKIGKVFSRFGEIQGIFVKDCGDGNKFAFVKFFCEEDSVRAIEDTNGTLFEGGRVLAVRKAIKHKRGGRKDDQEGNLKEDSKSPFLMKQGNPDIVPSFEANPEAQQGSMGHVKRDSERMLISHVETPVVVWGQKMNQQTANDLGSLTEQLAIICPEAPLLSGSPEHEKIYGAKFSEDQQWYRCILKYVFAPERVKVQYVDFGNTEELNPNTLVELPKSITSIPTCSMKLMLHSLYCNNSQDQIAIQFLRDLVEGQEVDVSTTARLSDHTGFYADLFHNGTSICEKMVESGWCFKKPLDQRGFKFRPYNAGDATGASPIGMKPNFGQLPGQRKFEGDKDESSSLRWKLKNLQTEYTSLSNKAQENDLTKQIKDLQALTSDVRKLRNQFPLDKATPLDTAISLVQGPGKISLDSVHCMQDVISAINAYRGAQDEIRKNSDPSILAERISSRDELRQELYTQLDTFIKEVESLPLQDRGKQVQDIVSILSKHYDSFTKLSAPSLPILESLQEAYEEWKAKKKVDVIDAQRQSDTMESTVNALLSQLKSVLSLDVTSEDKEMSDDLADTLRAYREALQQEINMWNNDNAQDTAMIGSLVQVLLQDLKKESGCVDQLNKMVEEFASMKEAIEPCLNTSPSLDVLHEVRKKMKSLKSKLRHMLADKADAEENHDMEELETIKSDLEVLRSRIHKTLKQEDKQLNDMSRLANEHFPELLSQEQDGGFCSHLTYKGLLKTSHAPDHYSLTPVETQSNGIFSSIFDEEPVIIREYFLSDGNHLDREDFLSQMGLYTNASSPYLEPVQAIFFDKNNRHAYLQTSKDGELLSTYIQQSVLSKQQIQDIVRCLCLALQGLHQYNFVHGQIQPEFVLVDDEGEARLLPPDFSLCDTDRCKSKYMTESRLEITAPEIKQSMIVVEPGHAFDVYCLGLLALWMHYPNHHFTENKNGVVDISGVQMDRNLGIFLTKLLCPNPLLRPTAENCLKSEYLCLPVLTTVSQPMPSPLVLTMYGSIGQDTPTSTEVDLRASPCTASDGLVYAESSAGVQMIANTRVPPPHLAPNPVLVPSPPSVNPSNHMANQQQFQHLHQQQFQQLHQQQLQQQEASVPQQQLAASVSQQLAASVPQQLAAGVSQQQLAASVSQQLVASVPQQLAASVPQQQLAAGVPPQPQPAQQNGVFEIGTFDPTAYEVVTSPQPPSALRLDDGEEADEEGWEDEEEEVVVVEEEEKES